MPPQHRPMGALNLDDALLISIACGVSLAVVYLVFEIVTWRSQRLADIKAISSVRELYRRSFALTRRLVPAKFAKKKI